MLCVHNLARSAQAVELDLSDYEGRYPVELFGRSRFPRIGELPYLLTLAPRGFYWFQLVHDRRRHRRAMPGDTLRRLLSPPRRREPAASGIKEQRWYASKSRHVTGSSSSRTAPRSASPAAALVLTLPRPALRPAPTSSTSSRWGLPAPRRRAGPEAIAETASGTASTRSRTPGHGARAPAPDRRPGGAADGIDGWFTFHRAHGAADLRRTRRCARWASSSRTRRSCSTTSSC